MTLSRTAGGPELSAGALTNEYLAGYVDYYAKDFDSAVYHLVRAVAEKTDNADAYYLLARAQWRRGRADDSLVGKSP